MVLSIVVFRALSQVLLGGLESWSNEYVLQCMLICFSIQLVNWWINKAHKTSLSRFFRSISRYQHKTSPKKKILTAMEKGWTRGFPVCTGIPKKCHFFLPCTSMHCWNIRCALPQTKAQEPLSLVGPHRRCTAHRAKTCGRCGAFLLALHLVVGTHDRVCELAFLFVVGGAAVAALQRGGHDGLTVDGWDTAAAAQGCRTGVQLQAPPPSLYKFSLAAPPPLILVYVSLNFQLSDNRG